MTPISLSDLPAFCDHYGVRPTFWHPSDPNAPNAPAQFDFAYLDGRPALEHLPWPPSGAPAPNYFEAAPTITPRDRRPLAEMCALAEVLRATLAPACEQIAILGSIRREKELVKDIEILAIGRARQLHTLTDSLLARGQLAHRLDKAGRKSWGDNSRRALWHTPNGPVPLDLFITTPEGWGVNYTLRTGDSDFSIAVVNQRGKYKFNDDTGNRVPGLLPVGWRVKETRLVTAEGEILDTPDEPAFFRHIGVVWVPPAERSFETVRKLARK
jgi:DNA polymerase/3'-5' exonuclease PolX